MVGVRDGRGLSGTRERAREPREAPRLVILREGSHLLDKLVCVCVFAALREASDKGGGVESEGKAFRWLLASAEGQVGVTACARRAVL